MLILNARDVAQALPMGQTIQAMKAAYAALSGGRANVPLRTQLPVPIHEGTSLFMPAYVLDETGESLVVKVVSLFPHNIKRNLALIQAAVLVLEPDTGRPICLLEGATLTAIRTGAASGAATDLLARPGARVAAIFGAGVQARAQLEAICSIRTIQTVWVYDPNRPRLEAFIQEMRGKAPVPTDVRLASSPSEAIRDADVICTATTSIKPVFDDGDLKPGVHINGVGSYTPEMQEVPIETVKRARVVVDSRSASLVEAGDLVRPILQGHITAKQIHAELGEIVLGKKDARTSEEQVTFFKSVGVAVQDAAAARLALENAIKLNLGQQVTW